MQFKRWSALSFKNSTSFIISWCNELVICCKGCSFNLRTNWLVHTPAFSMHKVGHTICCTDASTHCLPSRPMKLILFICMFVSIFSAWHRLVSLFLSMLLPYSIWYVCAVCKILISCFICRLASSVNKQDPLLLLSLQHLCACALGLGEAPHSSAPCCHVNNERK